jgi:hypothetical protein
LPGLSFLLSSRKPRNYPHRLHLLEDHPPDYWHPRFHFRPILLFLAGFGPRPRTWLSPCFLIRESQVRGTFSKISRNEKNAHLRLPKLRQNNQSHQSSCEICLISYYTRPQTKLLEIYRCSDLQRGQTNCRDLPDHAEDVMNLMARSDWKFRDPIIYSSEQRSYICCFIHLLSKARNSHLLIHLQPSRTSMLEWNAQDRHELRRHLPMHQWQNKQDMKAALRDNIG